MRHTTQELMAGFRRARRTGLLFHGKDPRRLAIHYRICRSDLLRAELRSLGRKEVVTKATHTPGPWERFPVPGHGLEVWTEGDGPRDSGLPSAKPICEVLTTAADANLIAAAPDLLASLTDLLCFASPGGVHGEEPEGWSDQAKRFCGAARAAIAKAKGGDA